MPTAALSAPESLFPRLEPLLPTVSKPIQYVGGELELDGQGVGQRTEGRPCAGR